MAALYVLWIGALAQIFGNWALALGLEAFGTWARAFTAYFHLDISIFIAITFPIAFLTTTGSPRRKQLAWTDVVLAALSLAVALYYILYNDRFLNWSRGFSQPTTADVIVGFALVALVIELCRRSVGWGLTSLVLMLLVFTFFGHWMPGPLRHDNFGVPYFIEMMTIMENGVFGAPLEVAATYTFLFVLFGSFYEKSGGGQLFFDLASAVTGRMRGGAAKACVTASGLYGSISGSPTADVATTGPLTIPIMKRMGIPAARAGAIEATASSGGAMLPPVMGAVAAAGVVIGAIEISALAGKFTLLINMIAGGYLIPTLLLSAVFLVLLGMGMPTPAVYIMGAALLAPALRGVFNLPEMQVHLFMLYFACLSAVTPPVAVANFAAGAIAGVNPMALGPYAVKLAIGGFILPFYFLFNPGLNMEGGVLYIMECVVFAIAMVTFASFAMQGYLGLRAIAWPLRILLFGCAVATVSPRFDITLVAALIGAGTLVLVQLRGRPAKVDIAAR